MSSGEVVLHQYVIYERPADAPESFVVREWAIVRGETEPVPGPVVAMTSTLELARIRIPAGMTNLGRQPDDDPTIVEVWT